MLDIKTHFKARVSWKGFMKGEALRLRLRTNSSETSFKNAISHFKINLIKRGYPETLVSTTLAEITFEERKSALLQKRKQEKRILPFVTQYRPSVPNLKQIIMYKWHLIQQQPLLRRIFKDPPIVSYKRGRSLKDILVRAKLWLAITRGWELCRPVNPLLSRQTKVLVHVCPLLYGRFARLVRGGLLPLLGRLRGFPAGGWEPNKRACSARAVDTAEGAEFEWKEDAVVEVEAAIAGAAVLAVVVDAAGEERAIRSAVWIRRSAHSRRIFWVVGSIRKWSDLPWHKVRTKMWPSETSKVTS